MSQIPKPFKRYLKSTCRGSIRPLHLVATAVAEHFSAVHNKKPPSQAMITGYGKDKFKNVKERKSAGDYNAATSSDLRPIRVLPDRVTPPWTPTQRKFPPPPTQTRKQGTGTRNQDGLNTKNSNLQSSKSPTKIQLSYVEFIRSLLPLFSEYNNLFLLSKYNSPSLVANDIPSPSHSPPIRSAKQPLPFPTYSLKRNHHPPPFTNSIHLFSYKF